MAPAGQNGALSRKKAHNDGCIDSDTVLEQRQHFPVCTVMGSLLYAQPDG